MRAVGRRLRIFGSLGVALVLVYLTALGLAGVVQRPRQADLAVVLGNTVTPDGKPSPRLQARLDTAVQLYRSGTVRRLLVSGGIEEPGHRDEAAVMAAYLRGQAVPPQAILEDAAGTDTMATARHVAALAGPGARVVVVTQWFHLPRTMLALRRSGIGDVSGDWPRWFEARDAYSLAREAVALPFYALRPFNPSQHAASAPDKP